MKRKIFTSLAAAGLLACTIVTTSAASATRSPRWFCFYWRNHCVTAPVCPSAPNTGTQTPSKPNQPEQTPSTPEKPEQTPSSPEKPEETATGSMTQLEQSVGELVNSIRQKNGLQPLVLDGSLSEKARIKSSDMKTNQYFGHDSPTYGSPFTMMRSLGITYKSAGENIAKGFTTAEAVVNAWMASDGHRANILSTKYTTLGVGYVDGYWTQWFIG